MAQSPVPKVKQGNQLLLPCESCDGSGNPTLGGGRNNRKDICERCGGTGMMPARTGETSWTSAPPSDK